jgi:TolB-like protein/Tfp pilus assembly protein PilF
MFTDIVGYTALSQRNEAVALEMLQQHRELLRPIFLKHRGHEVKTIGDAFLVEFESALEATLCAIDVQSNVHSLSLERGEQLQIRIGVHVGDIMHQGGDILGDAVNIASRIEPLASAGGICISEQVYDQVRNKVPYALTKLPTKELKNVAFPIDVYRVELPWEVGTQSGARHDRRRLAVLPFTNISADPNDEYFADGLTEELITTLSKIREFSVISRTSVMHYAKNPKPLAEIARELRAGTILEGSVRKSGDKVRVTIQMIDAGEDRNVWAETYDRSLEDIFTIQSDISRNVAEALRVQVLGDERERLQSVPTKDTGAYLLFLKGRYYLNERGKEAFLKAIGYFEEAIKLDPNYAAAYAGLSDCYALQENWGFLSPEAAWPKVMKCASKALELDEGLAEAHASMATALTLQDWDWKGAEREYRRALDLNPSYATAHHWYANIVLQGQKRWAEELHHMQEAVRLDPFSAVAGTNLGWALFHMGRREEGLRQIETVLKVNPEFYYALLSKGEILVSMGSIQEGTSEIESAFRLGRLAEQRAILVYAYMAAGRKADAEKMLDELTRSSREEYVPDTWFAVAYGAIGKKEEALARFEAACRSHNSSVPESVNKPFFDSLKTEARFHESLRSFGLE